MTQPAAPESDPLKATFAIAGFFALVVLILLWLPTKTYFDEVHYVPAARKLLHLIPVNREHPMFAKEVLAGFIHVLGDRPLVWRLPSALFGTLGLFAFGRLFWLTTGRRRATITAMVLLATNFMWFAMSRIAMLDMTSAGLCMVGLWQFAAGLAAARSPVASPLGQWWRLRGHFVAASLALGLSLGAKWSVAPAIAAPGLAFLYLRVRDSGWRFVGRKGAAPVPGMSVVEAAIWLGLLPLAIYWATYLPEMFYAKRPVAPFGFIEQHRYMLKLQDSVVKPHPYRSVWYQWMADWRAIWFLYEHIDGHQRGIVLLGNPLTMWAGLASLPWAAWAFLKRKRQDAGAFLLLYAACLGMWAVNGKPVQFYYHYLMPGAFLCATFALMLDWLESLGGRWRHTRNGALIVAGLLALYFYPILSATPLPGKRSFEVWMWLPSWR